MLLLVIIEFLMKTGSSIIKFRTLRVSFFFPYHCDFSYSKCLHAELISNILIKPGNIRVYCRVRPFLGGQYDYLSTVDHIEEGTIVINTQAKNGKVRKSFTFNKVFGPSATQG